MFVFMTHCTNKFVYTIAKTVVKCCLESGVVVAGQVVLPYLCAGLGMVGAGIVLDR